MKRKAEEKRTPLICGKRNRYGAGTILRKTETIEPIPFPLNTHIIVIIEIEKLNLLMP